jgi:hypothetical protein
MITNTLVLGAMFLFGVVVGQLLSKDAECNCERGGICCCEEDE